MEYTKRDEKKRFIMPTPDSHSKKRVASKKEICISTLSQIY